MLLDRLPEFALSDDAGGAADAALADMGLTRLLLAQFRWLGRVVEPHELMHKLFLIVGITPRDTQRDVSADFFFFFC